MSEKEPAREASYRCKGTSTVFDELIQSAIPASIRTHINCLAEPLAPINLPRSYGDFSLHLPLRALLSASRNSDEARATLMQR
jgi:hypothetical protein